MQHSSPERPSLEGGQNEEGGWVEGRQSWKER